MRPGSGRHARSISSWLRPSCHLRGQAQGRGLTSLPRTPPTPTLPHEGGGLTTRCPPPSWGRVGWGGEFETTVPAAWSSGCSRDLMRHGLGRAGVGLGGGAVVEITEAEAQQHAQRAAEVGRVAEEVEVAVAVRPPSPCPTHRRSRTSPSSRDRARRPSRAGLWPPWRRPRTGPRVSGSPRDRLRASGPGSPAPWCREPRVSLIDCWAASCFLASSRALEATSYRSRNCVPLLDARALEQRVHGQPLAVGDLLDRAFQGLRGFALLLDLAVRAGRARAPPPRPGRPGRTRACRRSRRPGADRRGNSHTAVSKVG